MARYSYTLVDVFTDRQFAGNQLAVFTDARGMQTETMQACHENVRHLDLLRQAAVHSALDQE